MKIQGHLQLSIRFEASLTDMKYRARERHTQAEADRQM